MPIGAWGRIGAATQPDRLNPVAYATDIVRNIQQPITQTFDRIVDTSETITTGVAQNVVSASQTASRNLLNVTEGFQSFADTSRNISGGMGIAGIAIAMVSLYAGFKLIGSKKFARLLE